MYVKHKCLIKTLFIILLYLIILFKLNNIEANSDKDFLKISSKAAVVIDFDSGRVLYDKNADEKRKMASLTKIMTSIMLVENCKLDELIEVPKEATYIGGSTVGLKKGDKVTAKALLYGMLLPSGNDCAYTVGYHIGKGSIERFADMMTKKAKALGLNDTSFSNPHGLDDDNHYTSAKSMAIISRYALKNKYINEIVNTRNATVNFGSFTKTLNNTNALLRTYSKADGVKTGFTNGANRCLVASASDGNKRFIAVILGADTTQIRFSEAKEILEYCFSNYVTTDISNYLKLYINIPIIKGKMNYYERFFDGNLSIPLTKDEYEKIRVIQNVDEKLTAPISLGTKIGNMKVVLEDEVLYEKDIFVDCNIYKKSVIDYFNECFNNLFLPVFNVI